MNILLLLLALLSSAAYPEWAYHTCDEPASVHVRWVAPMPEMLPFNADAPGTLFINHDPFIDSVQWQYVWSEDHYGVTVYYWAAYYNAPEGAWNLEGYVRNEAGGSFVVLPQKWQPCGGALFLPEIKR